MKRWSWVVALCVFLSGCGTQFTYNNLDWLIHWYVDDFIDLNRAQTQVFDEHFAGWHKWHRAEELPKYHAQLLKIREQVENKSLTEVELEQHFLSVKHFWEALRGHVSPDLANMATTISKEQEKELFEALWEDNAEDQEEHDEFYAKSEEERNKDRLKRSEKGLKEWIGKLTAEQKTIIKSYQPQFRTNWQNWIHFHKTIVSVAQTLFDEKSTNPDFEAQLLQLMTSPEEYRSAELIANSDFNRVLYSKMTAEILQTLTAKQERRLLSRIDDYIEDFAALMEDD